MKQSIFIDTDIVLDFLLNREPFSSYASIIFSLSEEKKIKVYISPLTISNCYYILRKIASHAKVIKNLQKLLLISNITSISRQDVALALNSNFKDLEDALQHYSAISHAKIDVIVTRNVKDYKNSELPVMTPETYLKTSLIDPST
ncbi:MAG: PIN domain-containing protein [Cyclobacteriaceae bacterium]|jgi:predicted nucleic acid-binding protein